MGIRSGAERKGLSFAGQFLDHVSLEEALGEIRQAA